VTRTWIDNGNFTPDCDLTNVLAQDFRATGGESLFASRKRRCNCVSVYRNRNGFRGV